MTTSPNKYFLPYQMRWLNDDSPVKLWDKSRRIGATYVQAYEDVRDCMFKKIPAVWFSSADETAAKEYIMYCAQWAKLFDKGAKDLGEVVIDSEKEIKALQIAFSNGTRIHALSSNPKAFRSKGGKVVLDEFAYHTDARALWKAARPAITWGFPLRILSTHNGKQCLFYKFIESIRQKKTNWSYHKTDIFLAAQEGLVEKIKGRKVTQKEIDDWIEEQRRDAFDEHTWLEEYCCIPVDEASAFLSYEMITGCEVEELPFDLSMPGEGDWFVGFDVGRKKDLSIIWLIEKLRNTRTTLKVHVMEKAPFRVQREVLFSYLSHPRVRRACLDATGLGMQLAEEAEEKFGKHKIESITFSGRIKEEMAFKLKSRFEDHTITVPSDKDVREDLHSVRKIMTASNNVRLEADKNADVSGHADRFWACALANHASDNDAGPVWVTSGATREMNKLLQGFGK